MKITKNIYKIFFRLLLIFNISIILSSCDGPEYCVDADDFGSFYKLTVDSKPDTIYGSKTSQIVPWVETSARVSGDFISVVVTPDNEGGEIVSDSTKPMVSAWSTWYGNNDGTVSDIQKKLDYCTYSDSIFHIANPPCILQNGVGLYMLIADKDKYNPNNNGLSVMKYPPFLSKGISYNDIIHLGFDKTAGFAAINEHRGVDTGGFRGDPLSDWQGKAFYFKIVDNYYADNAGSYSVTIKSGFYNQDLNFVSIILNYTLNAVNNVVQEFFNNFLAHNTIVSLIRITLSLFIIMQGILFAMGLFRANVGELVKRIFKLSMVAILLTPKAWQFFYDNFFQMFMKGNYELLGYLTNTTPGDLTFFDPLIKLFYTKEVWMKILALATSGYLSIFLGIFFIIAFCVAFYLLGSAMYTAISNFMLGMMAVALLIILFPVFLVFILFEKTKEFMDNWLKLAGVYAFRIVLIVLAYNYMGTTMLTIFQDTLGYRICWTKKIDAKISSLWWWNVSISSNKKEIYAPGYFSQGGSIDTSSRTDLVGMFQNSNEQVSSSVCQPYQCKTTRYVDLPFLIPDGVNDTKLGMVGAGSDQEQIDYMLNNQTIPWLNIIKLFFFVLLFKGTIDTIVGMSTMLSGLSFSLGDTSIEKQAGGLANVLEKPEIMAKDWVKKGAVFGVKTAFEKSGVKDKAKSAANKLKTKMKPLMPGFIRNQFFKPEDNNDNSSGDDKKKSEK